MPPNNIFITIAMAISFLSKTFDPATCSQVAVQTEFVPTVSEVDWARIDLVGWRLAVRMFSLLFFSLSCGHYLYVLFFS